MNRRSFFGFACGGIAAAPLALVGEKAVARPVASEFTPSAGAKTVIVTVEGDAGDAHIRRLVQEGVRQAMNAHERGLHHRLWETRRS